MLNKLANQLKNWGAKLRSLIIKSEAILLLIWQSGRIKYVENVFCAAFCFSLDTCLPVSDSTEK